MVYLCPKFNIIYNNTLCLEYYLFCLIFSQPKSFNCSYASLEIQKLSNKYIIASIPKKLYNLFENNTTRLRRLGRLPNSQSSRTLLEFVSLHILYSALESTVSK